MTSHSLAKTIISLFAVLAILLLPTTSRAIGVTPTFDSVKNPSTPEGAIHTVTITIIDPDNSPWTYWVDWNNNGSRDVVELTTDTSKTVSMSNFFGIMHHFKGILTQWSEYVGP